MLPEEVFMLAFTLSIIAGVFIVFLGLRQRSQQLEMHHRERMAMIERGQIPLSDPPEYSRGRRASGAPASRSLSIGIIIVGVGLALMTIIGVAGESPENGIGVGGAIAILGGAFIVRSLIVRSESENPAPAASRTLPPPPPSDDRI